MVTYALSVAAIVITGVLLIQGYRDTAAIHAKLDEIIVSLKETRNDVVGLEKESPKRSRRPSRNSNARLNPSTSCDRFLSHAAILASCWLLWGSSRCRSRAALVA